MKPLLDILFETFPDPLFSEMNLAYFHNSSDLERGCPLIFHVLFQSSQLVLLSEAKVESIDEKSSQTLAFPSYSSLLLKRSCFGDVEVSVDMVWGG
jgi:hypothetical protein